MQESFFTNILIKAKHLNTWPLKGAKRADGRGYFVGDDITTPASREKS